MLSKLLLLILCLSAIYAVFSPWVGICAGYFINILGPQYIWWWTFSHFRVFYIVALPTLVGFGLALLRGNIDLNSYKMRANIFLVVYFLFVFLSYFLGPWVEKQNEFTIWDPHAVFINYLKMFVFYVVAIALITTPKRLVIFSLILPIAGLYLTFWANEMYFSGRYFIRLSGPTNLYGSGIYNDENHFAMFFVLSAPFFFYLGLYCKKIAYKLLLWAVIPFTWHAVFLTASRGGLLGIVVTLLVAAARLKKLHFFALAIPLFLIFYQWQGGFVMKQRFATVSHYEEEGSASGRLEIWKNTFKLSKRYPLLGTGLGSFHYAYPVIFDYDKPRVAHNTFLQILGESGFFAFFSYVLSIGYFILALFHSSKELKETSRLLWCINEACLVSLAGFIVISCFLTLNGFEIFYYLLVIASGLSVIATRSGEGGVINQA